MRVLIVGDIHGQHQLLAEALRQARADYRIGAAIQVGDFGFFADLFDELRGLRLRFPVPVHVIDGNHEDHDWLQRAGERGTTKDWEREHNLVFQPRPSLARLGSSTVGFLGGALHVDRPQKQAWLGGLPNYILPAQREQAIALFNQQPPDLIITHSCPAGIGIGVRGSREFQPGVAQFITHAGFDAGPPEDCGEAELAALWRGLARKPRAWAFGHFHRPHLATIAGTRFLCVPDDLGMPARTLVIWDTEEQQLLLCPADPSHLPE